MPDTYVSSQSSRIILTLLGAPGGFSSLDDVILSTFCLALWIHGVSVPAMEWKGHIAFPIPVRPTILRMTIACLRPSHNPATFVKVTITINSNPVSSLYQLNSSPNCYEIRCTFHVLNFSMIIFPTSLHLTIQPSPRSLHVTINSNSVTTLGLVGWIEGPYICKRGSEGRI